MRRTKIMATIGPTSRSEETIARMLAAGVEVCRLNFAHGSFAEHEVVCQRIREIARKQKRQVAILMDLPGPKLRIGELAAGRVVLHSDRPFNLVKKAIAGTHEVVTLPHGELFDTLGIGDRILMADGHIELQLERREEDELHCRVLEGGMLYSRSNLAVPGRRVTSTRLTDFDLECLGFGMDLGVDLVAVSHVNGPEEVEAVIGAMLEMKGYWLPIVAKLETQAGYEHVDEILAVADSVMVARGALGVELELAEIPTAQKRITRKANQLGKPVIIATQMLRSMIAHPRPSRAEVSDVANAIHDGADCLMLSEETAIGDYPVQVIETAARISEAAENDDFFALMDGRQVEPEAAIDDNISYAACQLADRIGVQAIITPTHGGATARRIARYRPRAPIYAICSNVDLQRLLTLSWGVTPLLIEGEEGTEQQIRLAQEKLLELEAIAPDDPVVFVLGVSGRGRTNLLWVGRADERVGFGLAEAADRRDEAPSERLAAAEGPADVGDEGDEGEASEVSG